MDTACEVFKNVTSIEHELIVSRGSVMNGEQHLWMMIATSEERLPF